MTTVGQGMKCKSKVRSLRYKQGRIFRRVEKEGGEVREKEGREEGKEGRKEVRLSLLYSYLIMMVTE